MKVITIAEGQVVKKCLLNMCMFGFLATLSRRTKKELSYGCHNILHIWLT